VKRISLLVAVSAVLAVPAITSTQGKPDFSGVWIYNQAQSGRGTSGNSPVVSFPTELHIKHLPGELQWEGRTVRQDPVSAVFKLDGTEVVMKGDPETTMKGKAVLEGDKLVITSSRSYSSPAGDIVTEYKEVYSLAGDMLTVEKTQSTGGISNTLKAVYTKTAS
jgi:hypothetical protein